MAFQFFIDFFYFAALKAFMETEASSSRMRVDLYSREALIAFIAYCMIHAATACHWPSLHAYGVGLQYTDLGCLVLADRAACDAALAVSAYLRRYTNEGRAIFTLRNSAPTFAMAEQYASNDAEMKKVWAIEQAAATARVNGHWAKVQEHQKIVKKLREDLIDAQIKLAAFQKELGEARQEFWSVRPKYSSKWHELKTKVVASENVVREAEYLVKTIENEIATWCKPPEAVIQPLPKSPSAAFRWLFFLYMPPLFQDLSRMSFLAQQLLVPRNLKQPPPLKWEYELAIYYAAYQKSPYHTPSGERKAYQPDVMLISNENTPQLGSIGPQHVDDFTHPQQGIWYPDSLDPGMGWKGSESPADAFQGKFNPFGTVKKTEVVDFFTEEVPSTKELQWAMPIYEPKQTALTRGNIAIACQELRRHWLSKPGYLEFVTLRAFPYLQLRKLCVALRERSLPLGRPEVQTLIRQSLYHLGDLSDSIKPHLLWRTEWDTNSNDLLPTLCCEVNALADELAQMPRSYDSVAMLGELAGYLSDWHEPFLAVARRFAAMAEQWADDLEASAADAASENTKHVRAKQCCYA